MRAVIKTISDCIIRKATVDAWRKELPKPHLTTVNVLDDLREQTATLLDKRAEAWISENKLIHAGAARKLADELRRKV